MLANAWGLPNAAPPLALRLIRGAAFPRDHQAELNVRTYDRAGKGPRSGPAAATFPVKRS